MRSFTSPIAPVLLAALCAVSPAAAQVAAVPVAPGQERNQRGSLEAQVISREHGLSIDNAERQTRLSADFQLQANRIARAFPQNFLASIVNHGRTFSITLLFDRDVTLSEVQQLVDADLRPHLRIKRSRYTGAEIKAAKKEILAALKTEIGASTAFDFKRDRY